VQCSGTAIAVARRRRICLLVLGVFRRIEAPPASELLGTYYMAAVSRFCGAPAVLSTPMASWKLKVQSAGADNLELMKSRARLTASLGRRLRARE
jgi:hypothetical protein